MNTTNDSQSKVAPDERDTLKGWIAVASAFVSTFICFGVAYGFGAFFDSMATEFGAGKSATSLVFSITTFIFFTGGIVSGYAADRFGPKPVLIFGGIAMGLGLYLTSLVGSLKMGYITYGLGVGIGVACGYVPMLATVGGWFERRRAVALGVAVTGIGFGTLLMAPLAAGLINKFGWRQTYVIFAITSAVVLILCGLITSRPPAPATQQKQISLKNAIKTPVFRCMYVAGFLNTLALYVPFVFIIPYAKAQGVDEVTAASLVGIIGGASIAGRLGYGFLGDHFSRIRLFQTTFFMVAFSFVVWWLASDSFFLMIVFAVFLGFNYGGYIALSPSVTAEFFGPVGLGGILGAMYTAAGVGSFLGPPLAGYLIDTTGTYTPSIIAAMGMAFLAFLFLLPLARLIKKGSSPV
jgi:MFS family permease